MIPLDRPAHGQVAAIISRHQNSKILNQDTGITLFLHNPVYLLTVCRGEHYEH